MTDFSPGIALARVQRMVWRWMVGAGRQSLISAERDIFAVRIKVRRAAANGLPNRCSLLGADDYQIDRLRVSDRLRIDLDGIATAIATAPA
jgi:hypothetical protein